MGLSERKINKINKKLYNNWTIDSDMILHKIVPLDSHTKLYGVCNVSLQIKNKKANVILTIRKYYKTLDKRMINKENASYVMSVRIGLLDLIRVKRFKMNTLISSSYYLSNERLKMIMNN